MVEVIENIFNEILERNGITKLRLVKSNRPDLCDLQCNEVFKLAKSLNMAPMDIGNKIVKLVNEYPEFSKYFNKVEFAMPGFINITVSDYIINECLRDMDKPLFNITSHSLTFLFFMMEFSISKLYTFFPLTSE